MRVVLLVLLKVLLGAVVVVVAAPTSRPAGVKVLRRDVIPGASDVTVHRAQPLSQITDVVHPGEAFNIGRIFPNLAQARTSSSPSRPVLVLGSASAAPANLLPVNRQGLPDDSTEFEELISDDPRSLEDNSVFTVSDGLDSQEDGGRISSGGGVPLSISGDTSLITDLNLSSPTAAGTSSSDVSPGPDHSLSSTSTRDPSESYASADVPASPPAPGTQYSAPSTIPRGLEILLSRHSDQMTDPNMTLGTFLMGLNGKNGVMVVPASSLDVVQNGGATDLDPSSPESDITDTTVEVIDDIDDFELDLDSSEDDTVGIIASSNPSTTQSSVESTTTQASVKTVSTTTLSPTLFQGPLTELLYSKGLFLGTILGSLLDLGSIIMTRIMAFKPL